MNLFGDLRPVCGARLAFTCSAATIEMHQIIKARKYDPNDLFLQEEQSDVVEFDG